VSIEPTAQTEMASIVRPPATRGASIQDADGWGIITFDATVTETHQKSAEVTTHPVEDGVEVADHVRLLPVGLTITVEQSNTPLVADAYQDRDLDAWEWLRVIMDNKELVKVVTIQRVYENMILTDISQTIGAGDSQKIKPTLRFQEIRVVSSLSVEIPPIRRKPVVRNTGETTKEVGQRQGEGQGGPDGEDEVNPGQQEKGESLLVQIFG